MILWHTPLLACLVVQATGHGLTRGAKLELAVY
jgi:hypothetical protein